MFPPALGGCCREVQRNNELLVLPCHLRLRCGCWCRCGRLGIAASPAKGGAVWQVCAACHARASHRDRLHVHERAQDHSAVLGFRCRRVNQRSYAPGASEASPRSMCAASCCSGPTLGANGQCQAGNSGTSLFASICRFSTRCAVARPAQRVGVFEDEMCKADQRGIPRPMSRQQPSVSRMLLERVPRRARRPRAPLRSPAGWNRSPLPSSVPPYHARRKEQRVLSGAFKAVQARPQMRLNSGSGGQYRSLLFTLSQRRWGQIWGHGSQGRQPFWRPLPGVHTRPAASWKPGKIGPFGLPMFRDIQTTPCGLASWLASCVHHV